MTARIVFILLIISLLSSGCTRSGEKNAATLTEYPITTTLPSAPTIASSHTPLPAPSESTLVSSPQGAPVQGTTSTQINIRAQPSTGSNILGMIPANTKVEILGKDPGGNWYQINYQSSVDGKGWVTAKYITIAKGIEVPVIAADGRSPNNRNVAIVQQQINVRSGAGTGFNSLGILNAQDVVNLIGKNADGTWLQIEFAAGPDGKGWVNAAFVKASGVENLPIIAEAGNVIGTGTPTAIPPTATATVLPAWIDNDSESNPSASVVFEPLGTQALMYSGDVSTPQGDSEDWIQFTPDNDAVVASLECTSNVLEVRAFENGQPISFVLACGNKMQKLAVKAGSVYSLQIQAPQSGQGLQFIHYTIKIEMAQG